MADFWTIPLLFISMALFIGNNCLSISLYKTQSEGYADRAFGGKELPYILI